MCCTLSTLAQENTGVLRIAVIPVNPTAENLAAVAMVQAALETHPACETIERERIGAVLREKALSGDLARQAAESLGKTLQADGFLFAEMVTGGEQRLLHLTAVEARSGALVMARLLAADSGDGLGQGIKAAVNDALRRVGAPDAEKRYVAWLGVSPSATGEKWLSVSRTLTARVEMHLSELPQVAMLDRRRLQHVGEEAFISGLDQALRRSVILLDARLRPSGVDGQLELHLRARWPSSGTATNLQVQTRLDELERGAQDLAAGAASLLAIPLPAAALPGRSEDELSLLAHRTSELLRTGSWAEALESAEALATFAPTQQLYRVMLFKALDSVSASLRDRLGRSAEDSEGIMLDLIHRAVEVRTRYIEELQVMPVSGDMVRPFETGYRYRPAQTTDPLEVRQSLQALAEAEDRLYQAQLATGERYCRDHGYPFLLIRALQQRLDQLAVWQADDPAAQIALLRQSAAGFKRTLNLDIRPSEAAVALLLETVSPEMCRHFGGDPRRGEAFRAYLAELSADSNAWCRLAAGRGACTARHEGLPHLVPDGLPDDQELARRAARTLRFEILPDLLSEKLPRLKYKQEFQTHPNNLLERSLLLDAFDSWINRFRTFKNTLKSDPVRLSELAAIVEMTDALDWRKHTFIFRDQTKQAIARAVAASGQEALAQSKPGMPSAQAEAKAAPSPQPSAAGAKRSAWDEYRVMRAGSGYPRQRGRIQQTVHGVPFARDQEWLFLHPEGDILHVADVQGWKDKEQPLKVRLLRLQLPACQVVEDRMVSLECPVPDVLTQAVTGFAWGGGRYFLGTPRGLLIVDGQTFATKRLTTEDGLPCNLVTAVAWFDGALFLSTLSDAGGAAASLLRLDLASGVFEELAAQRTLSRRTPLDGQRFEVTDMFPDPSHGRLLLRIKWKNASTMEIWEWRPATKSLSCIQANPTLMNVYWLPSSRHNVQVGGNVKVFLPASDRIVGIPGWDNDLRIACEGDTVFYIEPWDQKEYPRAVHLVNPDGASTRRTQTDDGFAMTHLVALASTDAGLVLVNIYGETFLIRRRDQR